MTGWSWFTAWSAQLRNGYWLSTMPMCCPGCGLDWNTDGVSLPLRGNVERGWSGSAVFYVCLGCRWRAVDDRNGESKAGRARGS